MCITGAVSGARWDVPAHRRHRVSLQQSLAAFRRPVKDSPRSSRYWKCHQMWVKLLCVPGKRRVLALCCHAFNTFHLCVVQTRPAWIGGSLLCVTAPLPCMNKERKHGRCSHSRDHHLLQLHIDDLKNTLSLDFVRSSQSTFSSCFFVHLSVAKSNRVLLQMKFREGQVHYQRYILKTDFFCIKKAVGLGSLFCF